MALPASTECHPIWGREYPQYTTSYTIEALSRLLISAQDSRSSTTALETINTICQLGNSRTSPSVDHITLPMLTDLLDAIGDPGQLRFMAEPALISGCISLMASVKPSAFQYEYGYVCFRILIISLNALIMKDAGHLEETIAHMNDGSAPQRLSTFWGASSWLIYQKSQGSQSIIPIKSLGEPMLDQLLKLLYHDEKLFLTVSKRTRSLGLSGLMFALFAHLIATEKRYGSPDDHFKEIIRPYSRIFWRYLIVTPDSEAEEITIFDLHSRVTPYTRLYNEKPADVEDSINLLQALNDRLGSPRPVSALIVPAMLRFVAPLVVPGCEDLISTTIERCIGILWRSLSSGHDAAYARHSVLNFLLYMRDMLMALKPSQFNNQPWIWEVVDNVISGDLLDLALRVFSTASSFDPSDLQGTEGQLFSATIEAYIAIAELAPAHNVMPRFFEAGCIGAWSKCYFYFRVSGTENTFRDSYSSGYSINWACGEIIAGVFSVLMCSGWEGFLQLDSCSNPRCAMPCYAPLICVRCVDLAYCTLNCAALDWDHAWGGPHRSVCKQQAQHAGKLPKDRKYYSRLDGIPPGFNKRTPTAGESSLSGRMISHIRKKWSKPKASTFQGVMVKGDYRNPVEFQSYGSTGI